MLNEMSNNRNVLNVLFNVLTFIYLADFNWLHTIDMLSVHKYSGFHLKSELC